LRRLLCEPRGKKSTRPKALCFETGVNLMIALAVPLKLRIVSATLRSQITSMHLRSIRGRLLLGISLSDLRLGRERNKTATYRLAPTVGSLKRARFNHSSSQLLNILLMSVIIAPCFEFVNSLNQFFSNRTISLSGQNVFCTVLPCQLPLPQYLQSPTPVKPSESQITER